MKKTLLLSGFLVASFILAHQASAQSGRYKGGKSYQIGVGFTDSGLLGSLYYGMNFDQKIRGSIGGGVVFGKVADINYQAIFLDGIGSYALYSARNKFYLSLDGGISFIGDFIGEFESDTYDKNFSFNYGVIGGLEAEFYVSRSLVFVLGANQRYYIKKDFGSLRYHLFVAIRYAF